jgi:type VI secretion system protein ImpL
MNKKFWLRILISLAGAAAVAALIWFAGPFIPFGDAHPFEEREPRIAAMIVVLVLVAGAGAYRLYERRKAADRIARGMSVDDSDAPVLAERMKEALGVLRGARGGRANYLYDLPWYVLIGPPGSGKTTALVNSGLEFPLAPGAVAGVGGTRYCDWWFTEDAVLIDTAGRYTTQDSDAKADQKSWLAFLNLLKRNRPRQPINGVLVAISLEDLLTLSPAEVAAHAAAIRARLLELHQRLRVDFPVYALFTKADLVIGFMEFFDGLDEAGRAQVWGATFQTMDKAKSQLADVPAEFEALVERLNKGVAGRLAEEKDPANRVLLFGFPAQMAALQEQVATFLNKIFDPAQYRVNAALRGFYFTSGTQQGTPIDQLLGALAKGFGAEAVGAPVYSGQGKSFFLTDLIKKVVIGEAGWVSSGRGKRIVKMAAFAGLLVAAPLVIGAWWVSYAKNGDRIAESEEAAAKYTALAAGLGRSNTVSDRDLSKALPALHALRFLPEGYAAERRAPDAGAGRLASGLGLSQTARLRSAAETAYAVGLERLLRPRLVYRLEEQLEASADDPNGLFEALKVYLMLGGLETVDRQLLINWLERDWSENLYPGPKNSAGRKELEQHLVAMLDLETGHGAFVSLNGPLVEKIQASLARLNVADRAYQLLATRAKASLLPDWIASKSGGAGALVVFDAAFETIHVPYFHTKQGFEHAFVEKLPGVLAEMARDRWVLGPAGEKPTVSAQYDRLPQDLVDVYVKAFVESWRGAIDKLKLRRLTAERPTYPLLTAASSITSPFALILESIRDETSLTDAESSAVVADSSGAAPAIAPIVGVAGETPARLIDAALAPYHKLVEGEPGRRPIDVVISQLGEIRANLSRLALAGSSADQIAGKLKSAVAKLKDDAAGLPQPFARMMIEIADDAAHEIADASVASTIEKLRGSITFTCQDKITGRFPFARDSERDVALDDFARVFGPKGLIDEFSREHVLPAADVSGSEWRWRDDSALAKQLGPKVLADFQRAAEIRDAFFGADSTEPGFSLSVTPPSVSAATLDIDGTRIIGRGRRVSATTAPWPGPTENHRAALTYRAGRTPAVIERTGVWSLYRLLDAGRANNDWTTVTFSLGGRDLQYRINATPASAGAAFKPLNLTELRRFRCPNGGA